MTMAQPFKTFDPGTLTGHPFGRENEVAVGQLWKFFCNNVYLGQWELARAVAKELYQQREVLGSSVTDILRRIIENPYGFSLGDETIPTPHSLSHLCLQEYVNLSGDFVDQVDLQRIRQDVNFRLLIADSHKYLDAAQLKELYIYHNKLCHSSKSENAELPRLTKSCWDNIRNLLLSDPALGVSILEALAPTDKHSGEVQDFFVLTLEGLLEEVTQVLEEGKSGNQDPGLTIADNICTLLALCSLRIVPNVDKLKSFLRNLCKFHLSFPNVIKIETLYSALLGRDESSILQEFCNAYFEEILKVDILDDVSEDGQKVLSLCKSGDRKEMWKNLSILSYHQRRHFLDLIMETAMCLVKASQFDDLAHLLSPSELQPLRPLVLLVGWDHCTDVETARCLLRALCVGRHTSQGMVLDTASEKLACQVDLVEWCIENAMLMGITEDVHSPVYQMSLLRLETQSVLNMLHHTTRLQDLDHSQVLHMIKNRPRRKDIGSSAKKDKSVRFRMDANLATKDAMTTEPLDVCIETDAAVYRSYAAINSFMAAMHFCADKNNWDGYLSARYKQTLAVKDQTKNTIQVQMFRQKSADAECCRSNSLSSTSKKIDHKFQRSKSASATMEGSSKDENSASTVQLHEVTIGLEQFQVLYEEQVIELLHEGKKFLTEIYPLKLRVETLENIFSLLFLTNENIREDVACMSDSGEEGATPESRNGSRGGSRENISHLNLSHEGTPGPSPASRSHSDTEFSFETGKSPNSHGPLPTPEVDANAPVKAEVEVGSVIRSETRTTPVGIFSITKTELKGSGPDSSAKKTSGNVSNNSAGSTASAYKIGFISNPYIVRDVLMVLKECLVDLRAAKYRLIDQQSDAQKSELQSKSDDVKSRSNLPTTAAHTVRTEDALNTALTSSIGQDLLQQRMSRLSQVVNEALWRFQLIVDSQLPSTLGKISMEKSHLQVGMDSDDDADYDEKRTRRRTRSRRSTRGDMSYSTGESEHQQTTNDESNASSSGWTPKSWSRGGADISRITEEVIPLMLSDSETLLHLCLLRGRYNQARQVVKMLGLENSNSVAEVMFSEHYAIAVKTLRNLTHKPPSRRTTSPSPGSLHGGRPSLSTIANVAAAGMVTVSATTTVDQILSLSQLPSFSPDLLDCIYNSASPLASFVDPSLIPSMIILDLACVAPSIYDSANNLVEMMKKRQPKQSDELSGIVGNSARSHASRMRRSKSQESVTSSESKRSTGSDGKKSGSQTSVLGVRNFMEKITQLMHLSRTEMNSEISDRYLKKSIKSFLLSGTQPLNPKMLKDYSHMMAEIDRGLGRVKKALREAHKQETLSLVQAVRSEYQGGTPTEGISLHGEKPVVRQAMKHFITNLSKTIPKEGFYKYLMRSGSDGESGHGSEYLHSLYQHVKALSCLVHGEAVDKFAASSTEYFQMLEDGPTQILGRLIFVKKVPPTDLEEVAEKLHVNMMQIIINNCCGRIDIAAPLPPFTVPNEVEVGGKRVLNASDGWSGSIAHPGLVVMETLTKLIGLVKEYSEQESTSCILTPSVMACVVRDVRYYEHTATLTLLKYVDLSLLTEREDKLCFYGNLVNLMTLHVTLRQMEIHMASEEASKHRLRHSSANGSFSGPGNIFARLSSLPGFTPSPTSPRPPPFRHADNQGSFPADVHDGVMPGSEVEWLFLQNRMAYYVGQLGLVSLFDLKYFIIRSGLPAPECHTGIIYDRCHDLDPMDPWRIYGPPPEPRMLFVISDGHVSSPPMQVLSREMVLNQLRSFMKEYLQRTVAVDLQIKRVMLPQLLVWYRNDFATEWNQTGLPYEALLHLLPTHMPSAAAQDLRTLLETLTLETQGAQKQKKEVQVVVQPYSMDHVFVFDFEQFSRLQSNATQTAMSHRRSSSLPWTPSEFSAVAAPTPPHYQTEKKSEPLFHLTPASLSYLISRSEFIATLASLVGNVDLINLQKDLGETSGGDSDGTNLSPTEASDRTSIGSYRYEKLSCEFPHIWRHILKQIVPLESFDVLNDQALTPEEQLKKFCNKEHSNQIRKAIMGAPQDNHLHDALLSVVYVLILQRDWLSIARLFQNVPESLLVLHPDLTDLSDFACSCVAHTCGVSMDVTDMDSNDLWRHLLLIKDPNTRSRGALGMIQCWPVNVAIELLMACYHDNRPGDEMLKKAVGTKLNHLQVYQMVTDCAKNLLEKSASAEVLMDKLDSASGTGDQDDDDEENDEDEPFRFSANEMSPAILERLTAWQNVVYDSQNNPETVLQVLLSSQEFGCARKWADIYKADVYLRQMIEERYICFLLESSSPSQNFAFQALKKQLEADPDGCLSLCNNLINTLTQPSNIHFIASFMLRHLQDYINKYKKSDLYLLTVGCKMLLCLPESSHSSYEHLMSSPLLMFEQLLMNTKIEWLKQILPVVRKSVSTTQSKFSPDFTQAAWDAFIVKYARRALEFPVVFVRQEEPSVGMTRSESRASISSQSSNVSFASQASRVTSTAGPLGAGFTASPGLPHVSSQASISRSNLRNIGSPVTPGSVTGRTNLSTTPRNLSAPGTPKSGPPMPAYTPSRSFVMPPEPPTKDQWVPDSQANFCMVCEVERFSMFVRRHHCRRCGRVVCAACSSRTMMIRGNSVRTCDDCFTQCFRPKDMDAPGRIQRLREKLSGASSFGGSECARFGSGGLETDTITSIEIHREYVHRLSHSDDDDNERCREEFYYDQAPSTSLCMSIMELHSSPKECASVLVQLCDDVSKLLQPIAPGVRNPEVDYGLVISMLKYLLFKAKIKFLAATDNTGVAQCDMYLGRLELLKKLVAANCSYIPSMQQLTKMDAIRRLRDRLIEEERLTLAMDVSTKCGIDPAGVWAAWGKGALRAGNYVAAREKFSRCLKGPIDKNLTQQPSRLLMEILEQLETTIPSKGGHAVHLESLTGPDSTSYQECMYYLNTYGHHTAVLNFFLKHNQISKAVHYIQEKRCSKDVFVEGLLVPSLSSGNLNRLQDNMQTVDPTLERWGAYITAMCRYMDKNRLINCLYQTQIFVKDYIRAAMTCITYFYQRGAHSYIDLFPRLQHLLNAKHNLEKYLGERQWGGQGARSGSQSRGSAPGWRSSSSSSEAASLRLIMTPGEVSKYINTISLQIDVTKFLNRYQENYESVTVHLSTHAGSRTPPTPNEPTSPKPMSLAVEHSNTLPTLFGSTKMKAEVANLVMLSGNNVNDGFGLAFRIVQDFKLDTNFIYVQAARFFSRLRQYSSVRQLLSCISDSGLSTDVTFDEVISACVRVIASDPSEIKETESLIKMIRSDSNKINAYVFCGKLRSAYLIAVKGERVEDIKRISAAAERSGQTAVKKICEKWLAGRSEAERLMSGRN